MKYNVLMVANYPSDAAYAWWLMEFFWVTLSERESVGKSFVAYPKLNAIPESLQKSNITPHELDYNDSSIKGTIRLLNYIKDKKIRILYLTDQPYFSMRYLLLRLAGIEKIIVHDHTPGDRPPVRGIKGMFKALRNQASLLTADLLLNVSPLMKKRSEENGRVPANKCISVQNGIDTNSQKYYPQKSATQPDIRQYLGIPKESLLLVTASRLHPYKNVDFVIKAFEQALSVTDAIIHLLIIGDGPDEAELKALAASGNYSGNIHFLGYRNDVQDILKQSDMAIHCAQGEGFSLSIIEYMNNGLPVIVPDTPSVAQAIDDRINGLVFEANNIIDASNKIKLLTNRTKRLQMGKEAKIKCKKKYTILETEIQFDNSLLKLKI